MRRGKAGGDSVPDTAVVERRPGEKVETSRATNGDVPAFSDCVEVRWSEERGRYGVATRDLLPGTNILEEEPLASRINQDLSSEYCDQCLGRTALRSVPCRACSVVYCSRVCRDRAEGHHRWECGQGERLGGVWSEFNQSLCGGQTRLRITQVQLCFRSVSGELSTA